MVMNNNQDNMTDQLTEIRTDIKTLMVDVASIKARLPEQFQCPVHFAAITQIRREVVEVKTEQTEIRKDVSKHKWYVAYISGAVAIVLILINVFGPTVAKAVFPDNKPSIQIVDPNTYSER